MTLAISASKRLVFTAYGQVNGTDKGVIIIAPDGSKTLIPIDGKANCCIWHENFLYIPFQNSAGNFITTFQKDDLDYKPIRTGKVKYFYSHGFAHGTCLFLASFESGVDALIDRDTLIEKQLVVHLANQFANLGRSHYISMFDDHTVGSIDNALQEIQLYDWDGAKLIPRTKMEFEQENIRLLSYSPFSEKYYLNTEISNNIHILSYANNQLQLIDTCNITKEPNNSSAGNAISSNGQRLAVTSRGEDLLYLYQVNRDGSLNLIDKTTCGSMPRDVIFAENRILVTCTIANEINEFQEIEGKLIRTGNIPVANPVTFAYHRIS